MRALNARGYSAYALDMRGYGATPRDASEWLTPERAAADVSVVLEWLEQHQADRSRKVATRRPVLLGWSMGSLVAHLVAQRHPELISDLILFGYPRDPAKPTPIEAAPTAAPREPNTRARAISDFISPAVISQAVIDAYVKAALASDPVRADWRDLQQFNELDPAKVSVPTLLLHGERDPLTPLDAQARVFTTLGHPDRQWSILAGGDHAALIEDTAPAFVAAIVAFIERPRLGRSTSPKARPDREP
jgi:pimeloyl-ACP methyl ester carboxylesterase